jgi:hypothetical protein
MMKTKTMPRVALVVASALFAVLLTTSSFAADAPKMKMTTDIPPEINTPDRVETRLGTLKFFDGIPDKIETGTKTRGRSGASAAGGSSGGGLGRGDDDSMG